MMKRVRGEHVKSTVGQFLKRRHYSVTDPEHTSKKDIKLKQSLTDMALHGTLHGEGSVSNFISYSNIAGDVTACEQQFVRLKNFVNDSVSPFKGELHDILYPVFVHIYLELICNGHKTPAHRFFSRYNGMFSDHKEKSRFLETLKQVYTKDDVVNNQIIHAYREHKFSVQLTPESTQYLFRYLKGEDNMVLLQIFNQHIQVKDVNNCHVELQEDNDHIDTAKSSSSSTEHKVSALASLKKSIHRVQNGPPCLSSICFYTFINTYQGLSACAISPDKKVLCGGFEDSSINLWSLTPQLFISKPSLVDPSKVHLTGDYLEEEHQNSYYEETVKLYGHNGAVYKTCFTPDSRYLLSCSEDTTVRLWSMDTHTNVVKYCGHNYPVWDIAVSNLGCYFASCSQDKTVKIWSTDRVFPLKTFIGHTLDVDCVQFHPNGTYIASGSADKTVRLWDIQKGRTVRLLHGHRASVLSLCFSPDGLYLASAGEDRRIRLWDLRTGKILTELKGHTDTIHSLCFNQDSTMLASGGLDCVLRIWDIKKGINNCALSGSTSSISSSDSHTSTELLGAFPTKSTTVQYMEYTKNNLLLAAGAIQS